jgi:hypothetical protein
MMASGWRRGTAFRSDRIRDTANFLSAIKHLGEYACKVVEMTWFSCVDDYRSNQPRRAASLEAGPVLNGSAAIAPARWGFPPLAAVARDRDVHPS